MLELLKRALLATMVLAVALTWIAKAHSADLPPSLAQAVNDYDRATVNNDVVTLGRLVADDYILVNSDASVQDKKSYLADFTVPGFKLDPYEIEQPLMKLWGRSAMTGGLVQLSWTLEGRRESRLLRIVHIWVEQNGAWKLTYTQLTRVPPPSPR